MTEQFEAEDVTVVEEDITADAGHTVEVFRPGNFNGEFSGFREYTFTANVDGQVGVATLSVTVTTTVEADEARAAASLARSLRNGSITIEPIV